MTQALIILGVLIGLASLLAVVVPGRVLRFARKVTINTTFRVATFVIRAALGVFLIWVAPSTDFPWTLKFLGVLSIVVGLVPLALGNSRAQLLLGWMLRRAPLSIVVAGIAGIGLGIFLVYAGA